VWREFFLKIICLVARLLLGLVFLVFGLNGFLHFLPMQPPPPGPASQFFGALVASHYTVAIFALQVIGGLLLLVGRFIALGLTLLAPVIMNILLFHALMEPKGLPIALFVLVLWLVAAWGVRSAFAGLLSAGLTEKTESL
jgi:putative oxidoreductase